MPDERMRPGTHGGVASGRSFPVCSTGVKPRLNETETVMTAVWSCLGRFVAVCRRLGELSRATCRNAGDSSVGPVTECQNPDEPVVYRLDVALTPYGPEFLHTWIPIHTASEIKKGDLV